MNSSTFGRLAGRWLAALLATAVAVGASATQAAGCAGHDRAGSTVMGLDAAEVLGLGALRPPQRDEPPRPCAGPFCSGFPSVPSSEAPHAAAGVDQWAMTTPVDAPTLASVAAQTQDGPLFRSILLADPIFHPPRRLAAHVSP